MCRIPHTHRVAGRYVWRRRIHFRNVISKPVAPALGTADPTTARRRAAQLSARFSVVKHRVDRMLAENRSFLTGTEIEALFRQELELELARNIGDAFENAP